MSNDEYDFNDEDLKVEVNKGGKPVPEGTYDFEIQKPEVKTGKKGKYLKFRLRVKGGPQNNRVVFENYLQLGKNPDGKLPKKTASFFKALGLKAGQRPPGVPGGIDVSKLEGILIQNNLSHQYTTDELDDNDYPVRVFSWSDEGKAFAAAKGGKDNISADKIEAVPGPGASYIIHDDFDPSDLTGDAAGGESWGG